MNIKVFDNLFKREMTRKEFIFFFGLLALSLTGISGLFKNLQNGSFFEHYNKQEKGYGSKPYGA